MRFNLRGWSMFAAGLLLGGLGASVLFAPPELANQPPPWEHTAQEDGAAAAATHAAGAGPAHPRTNAPVAVQATAAASAPAAVVPVPLAAASAPATVAQAPAPTQQVARSEPTEPSHPATEPKQVRKTQAATHHAVARREPTESDAPADVQADSQVQAERSARSDARPSRRRFAREAGSTDSTDSTGDEGTTRDDAVRVPPPSAQRFDTFSGSPATATGDPAASGDPGMGDAAQ